MNINIEIIYIFIIVFVCLVVLSIILIYLYIQTNSKYTLLRTAGNSDKDESIIGNAEKVANKIVSNAKKIDEKFDSIFLELEDKVIKKWEQNSTSLFNQKLSSLDNHLEKAIQEIYKKAEDDLSKYKKAKLKDFDMELDALVKDISKKIISREIDISQHRNLIENGLERAKKDGLFG